MTIIIINHGSKNNNISQLGHSARNTASNNTPNIDARRRGVDTRSAFDMYDLSKTGFVTRRDFREAMRKLQARLNPFSHRVDDVP